MDEITTLMLAQIREVEERDEGQILAEAAGEALQELIYETERKNPKTKQMEKVFKLSYSGVRQAARERGNIVISEPDISETDEYVRIVVKVTDLTRNLTLFGGCHQMKRMKVNDYKDHQVVGTHVEDDPYYFTKGLSKAQRNALNQILPSHFIAQCISRYLAVATGADKRALGTRATLPARRAPAATPAIPQQASPPAETRVKPREEWDKITAAMVPDYTKLQQVFWNLTGLDGKEMYRQLGGSSKSDMSTPPWESFLALKEIYAPVKPEAAAPG